MFTRKVREKERERVCPLALEASEQIVKAQNPRGRLFIRKCKHKNRKRENRIKNSDFMNVGFNRKVVVEKLIPDVKFEVLEDKMIPNEEVELHGEDLTLFKRLVTLLDEVDDVQNVYHNVSNLDEAE